MLSSEVFIPDDTRPNVWRHAPSQPNNDTISDQGDHLRRDMPKEDSHLCKIRECPSRVLDRSGRMMNRNVAGRCQITVWR